MPSRSIAIGGRAAPVIEAAVRSAMARAREIGATSVAFPALGTGVGGFPLDEAARITVETVRDELERSPGIEHVIVRPPWRRRVSRRSRRRIAHSGRDRRPRPTSR